MDIKEFMIVKTWGGRKNGRLKESGKLEYWIQEAQ